MIDQTLTFRLCGTEVLAACCWSHGLPPCGSGSYIEGERVLRSGSFTFATFNFTVSGLVLLPFVGSVPAVSGFIWLNHFPSWLCYTLFVLSCVAVLLTCLIILISATCGHFYLTCVSLTLPSPLFCSFSHIFGTYLSSSALFGTLPGP